MEGRTISHYRIVSRIGEGGMGVVYRAEDDRLKRTVALKFLHPGACSDPYARERFFREAQVAAALDHPNICPVHEVDESAGECFIAMAYIDGRTLADRLREGPIEPIEAVTIAVQAADGLCEAHAQHLVHSDIKPSNIMLSSRGQARLMDFGLAHLSGSLGMVEASGGGTTAYMSPEQARCLPTDERTDIWSLGVVLYEMLAGFHPFAGSYEADTLYRIVNEAPQPIDELARGIPRLLSSTVMRALAKDPDGRFQDMRSFLDALRRARSAMAPPAGARLRARWRTLAIAAVLLVAVTVLLMRLMPGEHVSPPANPVWVGFLPFESAELRGDDGRHLSRLMSEYLGMSPYVEPIVIDREAFAERLERLGYDEITEPVARELALDGGIPYLVLPVHEVAQGTERLRARVIDAETGRTIADPSTGTGTPATRTDLLRELSLGVLDGLPFVPDGSVAGMEKAAGVIPVSWNAYRLFAEGRERYYRGDQVNGMQLVSQAADLDTTFASPLRVLAIWHNYRGDAAGAVECLSRAESRSRRRDDAYGYLEAEAFRARVERDWPTAVVFLEKCLEIEPDRIENLMQLGYIRSRYLKDFAGAREAMDRIIDIDPGNLSGQLAFTWNCLGNARMYDGDIAGAMEAFATYESLAPGAPDPLHSMANARLRGGDYDEAIELYREIIRDHPGYFVAHESLGMAYLAIGRWRLAIDEFNRYIGAVADPMLRSRGHILIGLVRLRQEDLAGVIAEATAAAEDNDLIPQAAWLRGLAAVERGDTAAARRELAAIDRLLAEPDVFDGRPCREHLRGRLLVASGRIEQGLAALRRAGELSSREFLFFEKETARACLAAGRVGEAASIAEAHLKTNPRDAAAHCLLAAAREARGRRRLAAESRRLAAAVWRSADEGFRPLDRIVALNQPRGEP